MDIPLPPIALHTSLDLIHQWLSYQVYIRELPGLSVGISLGAETLFHEQYGRADLEAARPLTPETLFRIASHSKLFTATAVMRLRAQGLLRLDDPAGEHLGWFQSENEPRYEKITIRHLLTHSSGLIRDGNTRHWTYDEVFPDRDSIRSQVQAGISVYADGLRWKYSNMGFTLLGEIVASVTGKPYAEAVTELVIKPLGLKNTFPEFTEDLRDRHATGYGQKFPGRDRPPLEHRSAGAMGSATGFSSTAADLLAFYQAHRFGDETLLDDSDKREMQRAQFKDGDTEWGLGFRLPVVGELGYAGHGGRYPGFITFSGLNQDRQLAIVVLTHAVDGPARELFEGISNLLCLELDDPERIQAVNAALDAETDAISGFYRSLWGIDLYGRIGGKLVGIDPGLADPAGEMDVYERTGPLTYRVPVRNPFAAIGEEIRFVADGDGRIRRKLDPASSAGRWEIPGQFIA